MNHRKKTKKKTKHNPALRTSLHHTLKQGPQIFGELSAALETNLRLCSDFPVKTKTPSLHVSGPFSSSQLRTGTGEMWATLAISIVKIKTLMTKSFSQQQRYTTVGHALRQKSLTLMIRYLEKHIFFIGDAEKKKKRLSIIYCTFKHFSPWFINKTFYRLHTVEKVDFR